MAAFKPHGSSAVEGEEACARFTPLWHTKIPRTPSSLKIGILALQKIEASRDFYRDSAMPVPR